MGCEYNDFIVLCPYCNAECEQQFGNITGVIMDKVRLYDVYSMMDYDVKTLYEIKSTIQGEIFSCGDCDHYWTPFPTPQEDDHAKRDLIQELFEV